ncbi:MAG: InlB B-repeat-containing protein [Clostridiales bacterium]|nr:InlB B-repeat-containing protein [Clostridiales bacterium]
MTKTKKIIIILLCVLLIGAAAGGIVGLIKTKSDKSPTTTTKCTEHVEVIDKGKAATCRATGLTDGKHCSKCGIVTVKRTVIPVIDHNYVYGSCVMCGKENPNMLLDEDAYYLVGSMNDWVWTSDMYKFTPVATNLANVTSQYKLTISLDALTQVKIWKGNNDWSFNNFESDWEYALRGDNLTIMESGTYNFYLKFYIDNGSSVYVEQVNKADNSGIAPYNDKSEFAEAYASANSLLAVPLSTDRIDTISRVMESYEYTNNSGPWGYSEKAFKQYDGFKLSVTFPFDPYTDFETDPDKMGNDGLLFSAQARDDTDGSMNEAIFFGFKNYNTSGVYGYATWGRYNGWGQEYEITLDMSIGMSIENNYPNELGFYLTENELRFVFAVYGNKAEKVFLSDSAEYTAFYNLIVSHKLTADFNNSHECLELYNIYPLTDPAAKDGHTFVGWYYDSALTRPYDGQPIDKYATIYPKYEINRYTVTFNSNCETKVDRQIVDWGTSVNLVTPAIKGYTLLGWYLSDGTQYTNQPITENTLLSARWEETVCTITFFVDDEIYYTEQVKYGAPLSTVVDKAALINLQVMSIYKSDNTPIVNDVSEMAVLDDFNVVAVEMYGVEKVKNTAKNNVVPIICGVVGGVALIALVAIVCKCVIRSGKSVKRKKHI